MSDLIQTARLAREKAYAPYSGYRVGAAVLDSDGRIWSGCNVENVCYPLGTCAERNAISAMILAGGRDIAEVAVVTRDGGTPCGGCLQALLEFCVRPEEMLVRVVAESGRIDSYTLLELIPHGFKSSDLGRTER